MVHCFTVNGLHLVLDVHSGALHEVDKTAFEAIKTLQLNPKTQIENQKLMKEIHQLKNAGQLFSHSREDGIHEYMKNREPVVKALCLHMAHECNLECKYCFAGQGEYGGDRGLMSLETGKRALDFLITHSGSRRNLEVDFFGGEPMLNFDVVKTLVTYGRGREKETSKVFRFTLTTNGSLLTEADHSYINANFDNVVLSLDGRPEINDKMRGVGSYADIFPKIKALADSRNHENYYVRGTYTRENLDFAADVLHLADAGFSQISVEPVVAPADADYSLRKEDLPTLFAEYEKLADALLARKKEGKFVNFFHFMMDLSSGPCLAKRVTGCGAGSEYLAVTPSGKLFPCHQFVGDDKFCLGDLDTGIINKSVVKDFAGCHVYTKPACRDCWAKYYCSGGCMANAYYANDDINIPDEIGCDLLRKRIEIALYMKGMI